MRMKGMWFVWAPGRGGVLERITVENVSFYANISNNIEYLNDDSIKAKRQLKQ